MQKKKITCKHRLEYSLFIVFVLVVKVSPLFLVKFNRKMLRFLFGKLSKRHPGIVKKNLKIAFPGASEEEISKRIEAIYRHFSAIFIEIVYIFVKKRPEKILKKIEIIHMEFLRRALEKKKGVVLFSAHFGNWELVPFILSRELKQKINSIARRMDNPLVEKKVRQFRDFMGSAVIDKKNAIRTILNRLKKNGIVYLLIDQNTIEREAVFVDFFGEKVSAVTSVSQLYLRRDVPVVPLFLHYEKDKIVLEFFEEISFTGTGTREEDIKQLTQRCTSMIEDKVKQYPEQWFWFHNRWKTRPRTEEKKV